MHRAGKCRGQRHAQLHAGHLGSGCDRFAGLGCGGNLRRHVLQVLERVGDQLPDLLRRVASQQKFEAAARQRLFAALHGGDGTVEQRLGRTRLDLQRLLEQASGLPVQIALLSQDQRFGQTGEGLGTAPRRQTFGTTIGAHRHRVLLELRIGLAQQQPTGQVFGVFLQPARQTAHHGRRCAVVRRRGPAPVAPVEVERGRAADHQQGNHRCGPSGDRSALRRPPQQRQYHDGRGQQRQQGHDRHKAVHVNSLSGSTVDGSVASSAPRRLTIRQPIKAPPNSMSPGANHSSALRADQRGRNRMNSP